MRFLLLIKYLLKHTSLNSQVHLVLIVKASAVLLFPLLLSYYYY